MAIAHVQSTGTSNAAAAVTITLDMPSAFTAGSLVVVGVNCAVAQTITSVTDSLSNSYSSAVELAQSERVAIWWAENITGSSTAPRLTATFSASVANRFIAAGEYSGAMTTTGVLAGVNSRVNPDQDPVTSNAVTAPEDGCLYVGCMSPDASDVSPVAALNSFTERFEGIAGKQYEDRIQATAASLEASWDLAVTDPATCVVAVFRPAAAVTETVGGLLFMGAAV